MTKNSNGFTVIELIFITAVLGVASVFFFVQKQNLSNVNIDNTKKTAINAMYYSLEEVYFPTNGYYPSSISADNLKSVDPDLFTDPAGIEINATGGAYSYKPSNCSDNKCKSYTLKTVLENEGDFVRNSKNN